jgi:tRNA G46 methylase TrmB
VKDAASALYKKGQELGVGGGGFQWEIAARTPPPLPFGLEQFRRGEAAVLVRLREG